MKAALGMDLFGDDGTGRFLRCDPAEIFMEKGPQGKSKNPADKNDSGHPFEKRIR
jgi:hypothetical protein